MTWRRVNEREGEREREREREREAVFQILVPRMSLYVP